MFFESSVVDGFDDGVGEEFGAGEVGMIGEGDDAGILEQVGGAEFVDEFDAVFSAEVEVEDDEGGGPELLEEAGAGEEVFGFGARFGGVNGTVEREGADDLLHEDEVGEGVFNDENACLCCRGRLRSHPRVRWRFVLA